MKRFITLAALTCLFGMRPVDSSGAPVAAGKLALPAQVAIAAPVKPVSLARRRATPAPVQATPRFSADQVEAYASANDIAFIRPGLKIIVNSVTIGSDRKPVVDLNLTDSLDQPLDRLGKVTPGAISLSFVLSWYDPATQNYTSYITRIETAGAATPHPGATAVQATADSNGTPVDLEIGHVKYTFGNALPAGFDGSKTHTLGIYSTRNLAVVPGIDPALAKSYFANAEFDFRPDGNPIAATAKWDEIRQSTSCNNCHDPLSAHGGSRQDVKLCVLCHSPQSSDAQTGNTVNFKVMIHKIHFGEHLPSVIAGNPYQIYGFQNSINDYSTVAFPQDLRNCVTCHEGTDPANKPAQSPSWYTRPTRASCEACHDDVNWTTGANHPGGPQADDTACSSCHVPDSGTEFDASIKGAHTIPYKSKQLKGLTSTIVSMSNFAAGKKPTVAYSLKNGDGTAVDPTKFQSFSPLIAGPTRSYRTYISESGLASGKNPATFDASTGLTTFTFSTALPADAKGSWSASVDIRRAYSLVRGDGKANIPFSESTANPVKSISVDGSPLVLHRTSVTIAQCNTCHNSLRLHGGQRLASDECVMCHNPVKGDEDRRPAAALPQESITFKRLIHRIHTGEELTQDFTVYGFGGSINNFNEVRFPGDRRNCAKCHTAGSFLLPLPTGEDSVTTLRDYFTPQGPATAACLGCHDGRDAAAHAYLNTTTFGGTGQSAEACATCHGIGKDWDVAKVHAR
ncbi:MAG: OmcA/MtrC family decaheme c-type cytochrome [Acidobacteriota bacterium]